MQDTPTIELTAEQQNAIDKLLRSGRFHGANDVVSVGLRLLEEREREAEKFIDYLEAEIDIGLASGPALPMEPAADLLVKFRKMAE